MKTTPRRSHILRNVVLPLIGIVIVLACGIGYLYQTYRHRDDKPYVLLPINERACFIFSLESLAGDNGHKLPQELVINSEKEYGDLIQYRISNCTDPLPKIDFSQSTVLGKFAFGSCGTLEFTRQYNRNDIEKVVKYSVHAKDEGMCISSFPSASMNFIVVPKIPSDYKTVFEPNPLEIRRQ